jgi:carboxyl-terminal processing protease
MPIVRPIVALGVTAPGCYRTGDGRGGSVVIRRTHGSTLALLGLVIVLTGCGPSPAVPSDGSGSGVPSAAPSDSTPAATVASSASAPAPASVSVPTTGERACAWKPGDPVATMPDAVIAAPVPTPQPVGSPPPASTVDLDTTKKQIATLNALANTVTQKYIDPAFNGKDWSAIVNRYRVLVEGGLTDDDFYIAMELMVDELGDDHSQFQSPAARKEADAELAGHNDYVGIGVSVEPLPEAGLAVVILTFPGSAAEAAGIQAHDAILKIDGVSVFDANGKPTVNRLRGPEGTDVVVTVQRPGEAAHDLTIKRAKVAGGLPIGACLIAGTRVGYIFVPTLYDETITGQVRSALRKMTAEGPLTGLIIDNREDPGGSSTVLEPMLGFFVSGDVGSFKSRTDSRPLAIVGEDIGGSQTVPLVVLVGRDTVSFGEIMSGTLQAQGRAVVIGETTFGNVETLSAFDFKDGSRAWLARETFAADKAKYGPWEVTGIEPDVSVPTRWDLFTEASDPAFPAALQALGIH